MNKRELENELRKTRACDISALSQAYNNIEKCTNKNYMGSAVTLTIKNINLDNNIIIKEFSISDGLSEETIGAIKKDIKRTYELRVSLNNIK